jgi:hypothetical protein
MIMSHHFQPISCYILITRVGRSIPLSNATAISGFVHKAIGWSQVAVACRTARAME